MAPRVSGEQARQGRLGFTILKLLIASMALALAAWIGVALYISYFAEPATVEETIVIED